MAGEEPKDVEAVSNRDNDRIETSPVRIYESFRPMTLLVRWTANL